MNADLKSATTLLKLKLTPNGYKDGRGQLIVHSSWKGEKPFLTSAVSRFTMAVLAAVWHYLHHRLQTEKPRLRAGFFCLLCEIGNELILRLLVTQFQIKACNQAIIGSNKDVAYTQNDGGGGRIIPYCF